MVGLCDLKVCAKGYFNLYKSYRIATAFIFLRLGILSFPGRQRTPESMVE